MGALANRLDKNPDSVAKELHALLGLQGAEFTPPAGVLHVCSAFDAADDTIRAIRIGEGAPGSEHDSFLLRAARAQADAIITTGSILRHEADVTLELGDDAIGRALTRYRRAGLGKLSPPRSVILSASGDLPEQHPLFADWTTTSIWTSPERVAEVRARVPGDVDVIGHDGDVAGAVLAYLAKCDATRVSLETGPSAVAPFYEAQRVTELWCSRYEDVDGLGRDSRGGAWPFDAETLDDWWAGGSERIEPSGAWRFDRYLPAW